MLADVDGTPLLIANPTPQYVRVAADGGILVLDHAAKRVLRYRPDGSLRDAIGRRGRGPGEFVMPGTLMLRGDTLAVHDGMRRVIVRWAALGDSLLPELPPEVVGDAFNPLALRGSSTLQPRERDADGGRLLAVGWSADSAPLLTLVDSTRRTRVDLGCSWRAPDAFPPVLSPRPHLAHDGQRTVVAGGTPHYEVWVVGPRGERLRISRDLPLRAPTRAEVRAHAPSPRVSLVNTGEQCGRPADEMVERVGVAAWVPQVHGLGVTADGSIWVRRSLHRGPEAGLIDQFDAGGRLVATWRDAWMPLAALPDGRFIVERLDEESGGRVLELVRLPIP